MARTFLTLSFLAFAAFASAQDREINIVDSPDMVALADTRTALVDKASKLSTEQTAQVKDLYLKVERQMAAIHLRLDSAEPKMAQEDKDRDLAGQYANWDKWTNDQLSHILSQDQMAKWLAANK